MSCKNSLHIAISTDSNYLPHAATLCRSIAAHNGRFFDDIHIHLMHSDLAMEGGG